jgi:putative ABC transport system permease protein
MDGLWQDLRVAFRVLAAHRQFTIVASLLLAIAIGATTAVFSVVNAVLLRPLPYSEPERLVAITSVYTSAASARRVPVVVLTDLAEWRERSSMFSSMGAFAYTQLPVRAGDRSFSPVTALMDPEFLPTLGNALAMGSYFDADRIAAADMSAIVSHAFWRDALGSDPRAIGRTIAVDGSVYEVRGVLAADFQFPRSDASYFTKPVELLVPSSSFQAFPPGSRQWFGIARLKPGVTLQQAEAELVSIAKGLAPAAAGGEAWSVALSPLHDETTRRSRGPLVVILCISVVLLLIAATNLMNLFFARGVARLREMAIRRAVGSSTARLVRQLLVEGLLLASIGGALGVLLAAYAINALVALSPVHLPVTQAITIDRTVLAFTVLACLAAALAASFFPALHVSARTNEAVRTPGMRVSPGRGAARAQQVLCAAQIALGMALLAAAGLLTRSLWELSTVEPGFEAGQVLGFNLAVPNDVSLEDRKRFYARALEEIRTIPGVERAGLISFLPPETRAGVFMGLSIDGVPATDAGVPPRTVNTLISGHDYFGTVRMPIVRGRDFTPRDTADSPPIAIVNEALVRRYFAGGDALGRRIGTGFDSLEPVREIVGIVKDAHDRGLGIEPFPTVYLPFQQFSLPYGSIAVRTAVTPESIVPVVRDRLHRLDPNVPVTDFQRLDDRLFESLREPRFYTLTAAACASMAVLFVTLGLYGLIAYSVSRRTSELGIRMAIGARSGTIVGMVLRQALRISAAGVTAGLVLAFIFTRALTSLLFQVRPLDPATLAASAALVVLVTLAASYIPARRAGRISPMAALRYE